MAEVLKEVLKRAAPENPSEGGGGPTKGAPGSGPPEKAELPGKTWQHYSNPGNRQSAAESGYVYAAYKTTSPPLKLEARRPSTLSVANLPDDEVDLKAEQGGEL